MLAIVNISNINVLSQKSTVGYNSVRHVTTGSSNCLYLSCSVCLFFTNLFSCLQLCGIRVSLVESPGWTTIDLLANVMAAVFSGSYHSRNQTQSSLFQQHLTNYEPESQQQTLEAIYRNDRNRKENR